MNVDALHALTLRSENAESSVTVNQRALIDKVLARYSSENTLLRELLQNSDDANATRVKIIYQSVSGSVPIGEKTAVEDFGKRLTKRVIVKNNGHVFRQEDWTRLSRIAEGNPDEAKIGAFGVGFYSVFSVCEDPFITSGDTGLAFYWRNDQLFTRAAKLPLKDDWTTFSLNMREESEMPALKTLTKFLATSLTFSRSLSHIELWLDDLNLCTLQRLASPGTPLSIPAHMSTTTSGRMLRIVGIETSSLQITATYLNATQMIPQPLTAPSKFFSFFTTPKPVSSSADLLSRTTSTIFLRILTGSITSSLKSAFSAELMRATKKPPPKNTKIQLVTLNAAELAASSLNDPIFENLLTFPGQGRVFIGFPTHQTTGFSGHVGAPCVIPTVERESIDLVDRHIKLWNFEVLRAIGLLTRIAYNTEFEKVTTVDEAIHTMKFFSMHTATPQRINETIDGTFFEVSNMLPIFSSAGVQLSTATRLPDSRISFLRNVPILSPKIKQELPDFVRKLTSLGYIETISIGDIRRDLQDRVLTISEGISFLKYCAMLSDEIDPEALSSLLKAGIINTDSGPVNVGFVNMYSTTKIIPSNVPLPSSCIPLGLSSQLNNDELQALRWREITVIEWLRFVASSSQLINPSSKDINTDPEFAASVLSVISKNFDYITSEDRSEIVLVLKSRTCIPTKNRGMQRPENTYFHTINMFDDLPLITSMKGVKDRFLIALGVRKTIDLDLIFQRLLLGGTWSAYDVIKYLASVRKDIPGKDLERLKETPLATAENGTERMLISQLYEPTESLRLLNLPVISWPKDRFKDSSEECSLLYFLGLRKYPSHPTLLKMAANPHSDAQLRERALRYFVSNFILHNYGATYDPKLEKNSFVPTDSGKLVKPTNVYTNAANKVFDLEILRTDLIRSASILAVKSDPPAEVLIRILLQRPPQSCREALVQFSLLATAQPVLSKHDLQTLSQSALIPIEHNGKLMRMIAPVKCFFKQTDVDSLYHEIFDYIDFGPTANTFLRMVGVRDEPSSTQIAGMLVNDAMNIWNICGSETKYKQLLTQIARDFTSLKKDRHLLESMKRTKFLLSYKYIQHEKTDKEESATWSDPDEEPVAITTSLMRASDMVIIDDVIDFNLFRKDIQSCPQDHLIEELCRELGSPRISSIIKDRPITTGSSVISASTTKLKVDILERLSVFLHESNTRPKINVKDLNKNLVVVMKNQVALQRDLWFGNIKVSKHVKSSALILQEGNTVTLVVTQEPENYDIAVAICKLVLPVSKPGDYLLLETLLTNSLKTLKLRGYNVERILQKQEREKKERQARIQAQEQQKAIDIDQNQRASQLPDKFQPEPSFTEQDGSVKAVQSVQRKNDTTSTMPAQHKLANGFMANIKKSLGLENSLSPTISPDTRSVNVPVVTQSTSAISPIQSQIAAKPVTPETVTSQASINQALQKAIQMTRNSDDNSVFTRGQHDQVAEAKTFCDSKPAQDLVLAGMLPNGMKLFHHRDLPDSVQEHIQSARTFSELLTKLGTVFNINAGSISICYDTSGSTIAFNKNGTIYCNLRFFRQLHERLPDSGDAMTYWYVTLAHEIAHNLVSEHSSEHEFYMESLIIQFCQD